MGSDVSERPTWRGRMHAWAFACSVPAGTALLASADGATARASAAVFAVSLALVLGTSGAYHRLAHSPVARRRMRRLDHSMIYVLIAGTYTPLCVLVLPRRWGVPMLVAVWAGAAAGVVLKVVGIDKLRVLANSLYIVMGWLAVLALPAIVPRVSTATLALMLFGGVAYTAGAIVLLRHRPDPNPAVFGFHEVWHVCTLVGAASHYAMVWHLAA